MNSEMIAVARGLKCGGFGAYGLTPTGAVAHGSVDRGAGSADSSPSRPRRYASARPLMPPPERKRNSRRSQKYLLHRCDISLPQVQKLVQVDEDVCERDQ